jgi:hypothetical protein
MEFTVPSLGPRPRKTYTKHLVITGAGEITETCTFANSSKATPLNVVSFTSTEAVLVKAASGQKNSR